MSVNELRHAIIDGLPSETSLGGASPTLERVYLPVSHVKALGLDAVLVIGGRGVGKSFWWAVLQDAAIRESMSRHLHHLAALNVAPGHGEKPNIRSYPDMATFQKLIDAGHEPIDVWRAVAARWIGAELKEDRSSEAWEKTVSDVKQDPESFAGAVERADASFRNLKRHGLIVFDALDRSGHDWRTMDRIVRDLFRFVLYLKPFGNVHAKVFLRDDQFEGRNVKNFPDASKILATRVELTWRLVDLHGLLWQHLINAPMDAGTNMRRIVRSASQIELSEAGGVFPLPDKLRREESLQRILFRELAGEWMGKDPHRGIPYTWTVSHLADGHGRVSPRSFIAAIRKAAEDGLERYPDHRRPLHYESIKRGVQKASKIRVDELAEDYPWVVSLMKPLAGMMVPCGFSEIQDRWTEFHVLETRTFAEDRLPPEHLEAGPQGVRADLESLGVFQRLRDGRVNMPDLYRVGFRLGRRGGVRPLPRGDES